MRPEGRIVGLGASEAAQRRRTADSSLSSSISVTNPEWQEDD